MNNPLLSLYPTLSSDGSPFDLFASRDELFAQIKKNRHFDVVIVGGGIHGVSCARLAAFNGLRTLLLEKGDYASETSSRSSKMAHGGIRYLQYGDLEQVKEGVRAREELFHTAGHLVHPAPFWAPCPTLKSRLMMKAGLTFYDLFVRESKRAHRWQNASEFDPAVRDILSRLSPGGYVFYDGIMDDSRVVIDTLVGARQEGAITLNHAEVKSFSHRTSDNKVEIGFVNHLTLEHMEVTAGAVLNCTGPWAPFLGKLDSSLRTEKVRYSRGVHLLFSVPWKGPSLLLPLSGYGRYYFVWPHFSGTMVGTTEREVSEPEYDPQPWESEIEELLGRMQQDLPGSNLTRENIHYAFAGVRVLPVRKGGGAVSSVSRKHIWEKQGAVFTLLGGKYTTAPWTAYEGLSLVWKESGLSGNPVSLQGRPFPGNFTELQRAELLERLITEQVPEELAVRALRLFGKRAAIILTDPALLATLEGDILKGELEIATKIEQAMTVEDILKRRLLLEYYPHHGQAALTSVITHLSSIREREKIDQEANVYTERLAALHNLFHQENTSHDSNIGKTG